MTDPSPPVSDSDSSARKPRVLIVQPNRAYASMLARRIAKAGYRVAAADSAQLAMAELLRLPADLILSELKMPGTSGVEMVRMVREDPAHRDIPVVLITGKSDAGGAIQAYHCGADAVVAKPFHCEVLIARIAREIDRARSFRKLRGDNATLDARVVSRAIALGEMRDRWLASEAERRRLEGQIRRETA